MTRVDRRINRPALGFTPTLFGSLCAQLLDFDSQHLVLPPWEDAVPLHQAAIRDNLRCGLRKMARLSALRSERRDVIYIYI